MRVTAGDERRDMLAEGSLESIDSHSTGHDGDNDNSSSSDSSSRSSSSSDSSGSSSSSGNKYVTKKRPPTSHDSDSETSSEEDTSQRQRYDSRWSTDQSQDLSEDLPPESDYSGSQTYSQRYDTVDLPTKSQHSSGSETSSESDVVKESRPQNDIYSVTDEGQDFLSDDLPSGSHRSGSETSSRDYRRPPPPTRYENSDSVTSSSESEKYPSSQDYYWGKAESEEDSTSHHSDSRTSTQDTSHQLKDSNQDTDRSQDYSEDFPPESYSSGSQTSIEDILHRPQDPHSGLDGRQDYEEDIHVNPQTIPPSSGSYHPDSDDSSNLSSDPRQGGLVGQRNSQRSRLGVTTPDVIANSYHDSSSSGSSQHNDDAVLPAAIASPRPLWEDRENLAAFRDGGLGIPIEALVHPSHCLQDMKEDEVKKENPPSSSEDSTSQEDPPDIAASLDRDLFPGKDAHRQHLGPSSEAIADTDRDAVPDEMMSNKMNISPLGLHAPQPAIVSPHPDSSSEGGHRRDRPADPAEIPHGIPSAENSVLGSSLRDSLRGQDLRGISLHSSSSSLPRRWQIRARQSQRRNTKKQQANAPEGNAMADNETSFSETTEAPGDVQALPPQDEADIVVEKLPMISPDEDSHPSVHEEEGSAVENTQQTIDRKMKPSQTKKMEPVEASDSFRGVSEEGSFSLSERSPSSSRRTSRNKSRRDRDRDTKQSTSHHRRNEEDGNSASGSRRSRYERDEWAKLLREKGKSDQKVSAKSPSTDHDHHPEVNSPRTDLKNWQDRVSTMTLDHTEDHKILQTSTEMIAKARVELTKTMNDNLVLKTKLHEIHRSLDVRDRGISSLNEIVARQDEKITSMRKEMRDMEAQLTHYINETRRLEEEVVIISASHDDKMTQRALRQLEKSRLDWMDEREHELETKRLALDEESTRILDLDKKQRRREKEKLDEGTRAAEERQKELDRINADSMRNVDDLKEANKDLRSQLMEEYNENRKELERKDHSITVMEQEVSKLRRKLASSQLREQEHGNEIETIAVELKKALKRNSLLEKKTKRMKKEGKKSDNEANNDWKEIVLPGYQNLRGVTFGAPSEELAGFLTILVEDQKAKKAESMTDIQKQVEKYLSERNNNVEHGDTKRKKTKSREKSKPEKISRTTKKKDTKLKRKSSTRGKSPTRGRSLTSGQSSTRGKSSTGGKSSTRGKSSTGGKSSTRGKSPTRGKSSTRGSSASSRRSSKPTTKKSKLLKSKRREKKKDDESSYSGRVIRKERKKPKPKYSSRSRTRRLNDETTASSSARFRRRIRLKRATTRKVRKRSKRRDQDDSSTSTDHRKRQKSRDRRKNDDRRRTTTGDSTSVRDRKTKKRLRTKGGRQNVAQEPSLAENLEMVDALDSHSTISVGIPDPADISMVVMKNVKKPKKKKKTKDKKDKHHHGEKKRGKEKHHGARHVTPSEMIISLP